MTAAELLETAVTLLGDGQPDAERLRGPAEWLSTARHTMYGTGVLVAASSMASDGPWPSSWASRAPAKEGFDVRTADADPPAGCSRAPPVSTSSISQGGPCLGRPRAPRPWR